jgi:hypothetical protein
MAFDLLVLTLVSALRAELHLDANELGFAEYFQLDQDAFEKRHAAAVQAIKNQKIG